MLSQYTWGQFLFAVLLLVVAYYLVVGVLYYRDELTGLLRGGAAKSRPTPAANPPAALVRTASAFAPAPAETTPAAATESAQGAAENLPEPVEGLVAGTLPDSTSAQGAADAGEGETAPMAAAVASAAEQEQQLDEHRPDEQLDEADQKLAALIRQAGQAGPGDSTVVPATTEGTADDAAAPNSEPEPSEEAVLMEKPNQASIAGESTDTDSGVEADVVYEPAAGDDTDPFAVFAEQLASPLDILPVGLEPLIEADSLAAFLVEVQRGERPVVPAELSGTSLAAQMADLTRQNQQELLALFGEEA